MSQSEIHANTERLKEVVVALPVFATDLRIGLQEIIAAFQRLGNTWRDDEYDRFKKCLEPLRQTIDDMIHELSRHQSSLQTDVDNLARHGQIQG